MGSRIREDVTHFFECFCEVVPPTNDKSAWIIQQFPEKYKDEGVLKSVPNFAYPYKFENTVIQHYSFVLTDLESKWTFGFCRHDPKSETAIVVLSYLPWHQAFYKFLDTTAVLMHSPRSDDLQEFLSSVYNARIAAPGNDFVVPFNRGENVYSVEVPRPFQLPSIPENRNLTEYYNAVDINNMIMVFASMLFERRIIFTSKKLKRLSACVQSANDIIYPMNWQHIFIPVLPMALQEYLLAPMPFLIGVPAEVLKNVRRSEIGDVVILDADSNTVESPFDDINNFPQEVITSLKKQLRNKSSLLGDGVSRAFLRALVQLIGGYRDALKFQPGEKVSFDQEKFIETRPASLQPFLRKMLHLQIFQQFIDERVAMLNNGLGFSDEFEMEACIYSEKSSSKLKQQYKDWASSMKHEGSALIKNIKGKANPAMRSAVKTFRRTSFHSNKVEVGNEVKVGGKGVKDVYKEIKSRLKENQPQQPKSAPNSPTGKRRTIAGFTVPAATYRKDPSFKTAGIERPYSPLDPASQPVSPDGCDASRSGSPGLDIPRIDLMSELKDLLNLKTPPVDRSLKPVRSLENFKSSPLPINATSPEHWVFPGANTRTGAPMASPPSSARFFLPSNHHHGGARSQDTQNLLQSPPEDVFLSPPAVPPRGSVSSSAPKDLFGTAPFVVGGGHSENGDPLFYVANQHTVDIVKLSPPTRSPRRKVEDTTEDLIRLDSSSDIDIFDPLKSPTNSNEAPMSMSNPVYAYQNQLRNGTATPNRPSSARGEPSRNDQDLLQEYGLHFNSFQSCDSFSGSVNKVNSQSQWTKFE